MEIRAQGFQKGDSCLKNKWNNIMQCFQWGINFYRYTPHVRRDKTGLSSAIFTDEESAL
jgi:hypothetical protein